MTSLTQVEDQFGLHKSKSLVVAAIPAFNEERTIAKLVLEAQTFVDVVLVCDDGSTDRTGEIAEELGAIVIRHERNKGYGASLSSLFTETLKLGADVAVTLDGDGQHDPAEIPRLVKRLEAGNVDIVIGSRFVESGGSDAPGGRRKGIMFITRLVSLFGPRVTDAQSGFRAYSRRALESMALTEQGMGASIEILFKAKEDGLKLAEVPILVNYENNNSKNNPVLHGFSVILCIFKHRR